MDSRRRPVARGGGGLGGRKTPPLGPKAPYGTVQRYTFLPNETPPPLGLRTTFPPNKIPPWEILATGLRRGMNAYMCGGKHGRQSHATNRIRLTYVNRTVLDGHVLRAVGSEDMRLRVVLLATPCTQATLSTTCVHIHVN